MNIILDDSVANPALYPFTAVRHPADIRLGILTLREKWARFPEVRVFSNAAAYHAQSPANPGDKMVAVDAGSVPAKAWVDQLCNAAGTGNERGSLQAPETIRYPWQIFQSNDAALRADFDMICFGRQSAPVSATNRITNPADIFLEPGAVVEHCILNASSGPIYVGKNALVMEGCMLRGPVAVCEQAVMKMGTKVYGATTIGPQCSVAGEIKNSVIFGFSNKAHDGYLGDSVIGEWCNLGAGTTNSNVKNTAGEVKAWYNLQHSFVPVGQKCGLLMGDYSRSAINTSFNTGTVVGVSCNIFTPGFPPRFVPDFTWGNEPYNLEKALRDIANWKQLKGKEFTPAERTALKNYHSTINN